MNSLEHHCGLQLCSQTAGCSMILRHFDRITKTLTCVLSPNPRSSSHGCSIPFWMNTRSVKAHTQLLFIQMSITTDVY